MFPNATAGAIQALKNLLKIVGLVVVAIAAIKWAHNNPEQAQALFNKAMHAVIVQANNVLDWLSTLGSDS
jgi:hypothetical protein